MSKHLNLQVKLDPDAPVVSTETFIFLLMHRFEREDVDDIKVHTPYEISIRQRFIGKPDISYRLISAKMPEVIPILEVQFSKKIELLEVAMMLGSTRTSSLAEKGYSVWHAGE